MQKLTVVSILALGSLVASATPITFDIAGTASGTTYTPYFTAPGVDFSNQPFDFHLVANTANLDDGGLLLQADTATLTLDGLKSPLFRGFGDGSGAGLFYIRPWHYRPLVRLRLHQFDHEYLQPGAIRLRLNNRHRAGPSISSVEPRVANSGSPCGYKRRHGELRLSLGRHVRRRSFGSRTRARIVGADGPWHGRDWIVEALPTLALAV